MNKDMEKRQNIQIDPEEIIKQRQYIEEIKIINAQQTMQTGNQKLFHLVTFGCQMNENDSERLAGMLAESGYVETEKPNESDLIIFNTCCVRENAELKVYGQLGALKKLKRDKPELIIALCGCMMQQDEVVKHIRQKYRHVDLIFGTHNIFKFPELLHRSIVSNSSVIEVWDTTGTIAEGMPIGRRNDIKAWVTVMYGCDNFCSYCIVPYVRGRERSRRLEDIAGEVGILGRQGYKEVTLLGQNVNSYGKELEGNGDFAELLYEINSIEGIERIRFMTSHPKDLSDSLIKSMRDCKKVCEHLHLPVQSGSNRVLSEMNRKYSKDQYLELITKIRESIPGISLTTDIIVGFPGETDEDFEETLDILEKVRCDSAYTFLYSRRTGTPAAEHSIQVPEEIKKERFKRLLEIQNRISKEINEGFLGREVEVLVEGLSKTSTSTFTGRTRTNKIVNFEGSSELIGKLIKIKIEKIQTWSLEGSKKE